MGYDPQTCYNKLTQAGLTPLCGVDGMSLQYHCADFMVSSTYHSMCAGANLYFPVSQVCCHNSDNHEWKCNPDEIIPICTELQSKDPAWDFQNCFCCCACFAYGTLIAVPGTGPTGSETEKIQDIKLGTEVLAASVVGTSGSGMTLEWRPQLVSFSEGASGGLPGHQIEQPNMVYIVYLLKDGLHDLIASTDQPVLLASGKLVTANTLYIGDELIDAEGNPVPVMLVSIGSYFGGVHHIGTAAPTDNGADGHLLLADGVVVGDFDLQMSAESNASLFDTADERFEIGSREYDEAFSRRSTKAMRSDANMTFSEDGSQVIPADSNFASKFKVYARSYGASEVPTAYQAFFTQAESESILQNGTQMPFSNPVPQSMFNSIALQLKGFFPDINFIYDPTNMLPNVYAYDYFGMKIVRMTGGFARMTGMSYEGLYMAMSWGVAAFSGTEPMTADGFTGVATCDFIAFGTISRLTWIGSGWMGYVSKAMQQWNSALFDQIDPKLKGGNPDDPLRDPSIDCRVESIQRGFTGGSLPACAGGYQPPDIALELATLRDETHLLLTFSLGLKPESATDIANYTLDPAIDVVSATLDPMKNFLVTLELAEAPEKGKTYTVTAANLKSIYDTPLDPARSSADFEAAS
ncbi:hypothetical protein [Breoghania sp.]|uniref:hypothetical protein n=1 Tax=Breoghania sp. TaxID=2065378 RepID=UPI002AA70097|nr:hypothetical protein [Breoghania sp.]